MTDIAGGPWRGLTHPSQEPPALEVMMVFVYLMHFEPEALGGRGPPRQVLGNLMPLVPYGRASLGKRTGGKIYAVLKQVCSVMSSTMSRCPSLA